MSSDSVLAGNHKREKQHRRELCLIGRWMYEREYIVACEGNLSVRLGAGRILTTPTCMNKGMLEPEDLVALTVEAAAMAQVPLAGTDWIPGRGRG